MSMKNVAQETQILQVLENLIADQVTSTFVYLFFRTSVFFLQINQSYNLI